MRLALVTQDFPPVFGGIQTYCWELARRFQRSLQSVVVIAPQAEGSAAFDRAQPFEVVRCPGGSDVLPLTMAPALLRTLTSSGVDVAFHAQWQTLPTSLLLKRLGRLKGVFVAAHGRELLLAPLATTPGLGAGYEHLRSACLRGADGVFPVSHFTQELAVQRGVRPEVCHVVSNGTDPAHFQPRDTSELRAALGLVGAKVLLFAGRLVPNKGVDTLLAALPTLLRAEPALQVLVIGEGPDRLRLEQLTQDLAVGAAVRFLGRVPYQELPVYYSLADVFVTLSRQVPPAVEGFGLVFLEAGACETAVIGAHSGGIPDAVVDGVTGLLVPPDAPDAFATAALKLLGDAQLRITLGKAARRRVLQGGTWDHAHDHLVTQMRDCLAEA